MNQAIQQATNAQNSAAKPNNSTWVSANAGSGKTRVLTDRVARLLLSGCEPQKILCLTYTKAAAAEMQNRLFKNLGAWAMKPDDALRDDLAKLGEVDLDAKRLAHARTLFARALETPGGLKIQTIHSFCGAILRRFPLEAGVSPQFQEIDERQSKNMQEEIIEEIATDHPFVFANMARYLSGDDVVGGLLPDILKLRGYFETPFNQELVAQTLGIAGDVDDDALLDQFMFGITDTQIHDLSAAMNTGSAKNKEFARQVKLGLRLPPAEALNLYEKLYLTQEGNPRSTHGFPVKDVKSAFPWVEDFLKTLITRMFAAREARLSRTALKRAEALHGFAKIFVQKYSERKAALGRLDFDDLIQQTRSLLMKSDMAAWVLFKLDGGIDHILVDEAQDTSPAQWDIVRILAEEFHSGQEDRETPRTVFVVGDEKQSIYSFQGADPYAFGDMRKHFADRLQQVMQKLYQTDLLYSFRSAKPVLELVDHVFTGDARAGLEGEITHRAAKSDLPGRVELWPFIEKPEKPEEIDWHLPVDTPAPNAPHITLAKAIAMQVSTLIETRHVLPGSDGNRPVQAGDFLILVQSRGKIFHAIIKALKEQGVDVAGADRLKVVEELAVKDLLALLQFMATPEDDLSLAAALHSPLFGLSEGDLFALAHDRKGTLWSALHHKRDRWPETAAILDDLQAQADFLRPYDLLHRILNHHDGRRNLIARLGPEAEDGIDELVSQALNYESVEAPLLTGFLTWISSDSVEVKRQMDAVGNCVRVMTVHGAKGLEAPIVILPDTGKKDYGKKTPVVQTAGEVALWKTNKDASSAKILETNEANLQLIIEESRRLLYVALTRAENWLIVCGAGELDKSGESWFQRVEVAMQAQSATRIAASYGLEGETLTISHNWSEDTGQERDPTEAQMTELPEFLRTKVITPARSEKLVSPSQLGGEHALISDDGEDEKAAMERGHVIHSLLEVLPNIPPDQWQTTASRLCGKNSDFADLLQEATNVINNPALADVFADDVLVEVPVTAALDTLGGKRIFGRIDRLIVTPDAITAIDFKSNRAVPATENLTPEAILRQMGAYAKALAMIYPDREIRTEIIWTYTNSRMVLTKNSTDDALSRASIP